MTSLAEVVELTYINFFDLEACLIRITWKYFLIQIYIKTIMWSKYDKNQVYCAYKYRKWIPRYLMIIIKLSWNITHTSKWVISSKFWAPASRHNVALDHKFAANDPYHAPPTMKSSPSSICISMQFFINFDFWIFNKNK